MRLFTRFLDTVYIGGSVANTEWTAEFIAYIYQLEQGRGSRLSFLEKEAEFLIWQAVGGGSVTSNSRVLTFAVGDAPTTNRTVTKEFNNGSTFQYDGLIGVTDILVLAGTTPISPETDGYNFDPTTGTITTANDQVNVNLTVVAISSDSDSSDGSGLSSVAFTASIPFTSVCTTVGAYDMADGDVTLSPNTTGAIAGATAQIRITGDGSHDLDLSAFKLLGDGEFDNTDGTVNLLLFLYDGVDYGVAITQLADIAAPGDLTPLDTPTLAMTVDSDTAITLTASAISNEDGMRYEIAVDAGFTVGHQTSNQAANVLSHQFTGLTAETLYYGRTKGLGDGITYSDSAYGTDSATTDAEGAAIALDDTAVAAITESPTGTYVSSSSTDTFGSTILFNKKLAAGNSGHIYSTASVTALGAAFGFNTANAQTGFAGMEAAYIISGGNLFVVDAGAGGYNATPVAARTLNSKVGIHRSGSALTLKESTDGGATWSAAIYTYTFSSAADLFIVADILAGPTVTGKLIDPMGVGVS